MSLTHYQSVRGTAPIRVSRVGMSIPGITDRTMDSEIEPSSLTVCGDRRRSGRCRSFRSGREWSIWLACMPATRRSESALPVAYTGQGIRALGAMHATHLRQHFLLPPQPPVTTMTPSIADILAESSLADTQRVPVKTRPLHPLDNLTVDEINDTVRIVKSNRPNDHLWIKHCAVREPVSCASGAHATWRLAPMRRCG